MKYDMEQWLLQPVVLENRWARLVPLEEKHYELLLPLAMDPSLWQFTTAKIQSEDDFRSYFDTAIAEKKAGIAYPFIIFDQPSGKVAGSTRYGNISIAHKRVEIGWTWYAAEFQRTGLNRACKFELLRFAFETLGCIRVELKTSSLNLRSQTAIGKIGATKEGVLRSHMINADGTTRDTVYFSILAEEWPGIKNGVFSSYTDIV